MRLEPLLVDGVVCVVEGASGRDDVLRVLAERASGRLGGVEVETLASELRERERRIPTSTPEGVAFPHAMLPSIEETVVVPALVRPGVSFGVETHPLSDVVFGMFGSSERPFSHVRLLARLARIARGPGALPRFRACGDEGGFREALIDEDRKHG